MTFEQNKNYSINDIAQIVIPMNDRLILIEGEIKLMKTDLGIIKGEIRELKQYTKDGFEVLNEKIDVVDTNLQEANTHKQDKLQYA